MIVPINIKIKHTKSKDKLTQNIGIFTYFDYYLNETYKFYRHLSDFIERFYLKYDVISVSNGTRQFEITYDISNVENPEYEEKPTGIQSGVNHGSAAYRVKSEHRGGSQKEIGQGGEPVHPPDASHLHTLSTP